MPDVREDEFDEDYGPDGNLRRTYLQRLDLAYLYPSQIQHLLEQAEKDARILDKVDAIRPFRRSLRLDHRILGGRSGAQSCETIGYPQTAM